MKPYKGGKSSQTKKDVDPNLLHVIKEMEKETGKKIVPNEEEAKYSGMLLQLIKPYHSANPFIEELQELLDLAGIAWNMANMKKIIPQAYNLMWQETKNDFAEGPESLQLLEKMMKEKSKLFAGFDMFIHEAQVHFTPEGKAFVTATAKPFEAFAEDSLLNEEENDEEDDESNFIPGFINRNAFTVTPKTPFLNWRNNLQGELFPSEEDDNNIYLIEEKMNNEEIEKWLLKNFDRVFKKELEGWHTDEKRWPKKRTYQMFCEWFGISYQSMIYDMEDYPVDKDME